MKKQLYCDIDSTINNHWVRVKRNTNPFPGQTDPKAFTREEIMKDEVLPNAKESLLKLSEDWDIHFLSARNFQDAYSITKDWLDEKGIPHNSINLVNRAHDKPGFLANKDCDLFIDDFSGGQERSPSYVNVYEDVISQIKNIGIPCIVFKGDWLEVMELIRKKINKKHSDDFLLPNGKTIGYMKNDNMLWWVEHGKSSERPETREPYYNDFLIGITEVNPKFSIDNYKGKEVGEICGGPYGGIIEMFLPNEDKYQVDIFADEFKKMNWIKSDSKKTKWIASPCEEINLNDDELDVLFGFNSIDHGWDYKKSIHECMRVSKECYINFDANRYRAEGYPDVNHYQIIDYDDVVDFTNSLQSKTNIKCWLSNLNHKPPIKTMNIWIKKH